jgi:hypothetical protein
MDSTILGERISRLIRDHFPLAFCPTCAAKKLGVSVFDFRNAAQMLAMEADLAITRRVCCDCGSTGQLLGLTPAASEPPSPPMDAPSLRKLIQSKLAEGRLPYKILPRITGGPGKGETCDACGERITKDQMGMEEIVIGQNALRFHIRCFNAWDELCRSAST